MYIVINEIPASGYPQVLTDDVVMTYKEALEEMAYWHGEFGSLSHRIVLYRLERVDLEEEN